MSEQIACDKCGALLVKRVTSRGVTPADGEVEIPFRRNTDFVLCSTCLTPYNVRDLMNRVRTDEDPEDEADVIMLLERLAARKRRGA